MIYGKLNSDELNAFMRGYSRNVGAVVTLNIILIKVE